MSRQAIVTGASDRVGRACAIALAAEGFQVLGTCRNNSEGLARTGEMCQQASASAGSGAEFRGEVVDFADARQLERFTQLVSSMQVDVLVNNAATYGRTSLQTLTIDEASGMMRVNAVAPLILSAACSASLRTSTLPGGGVIACLSDIHAMGRPRRGFSAYSMSKAAISEMVRSLALDLAPTVRVIGIAPGVVAWNEIESEPDRQAYLDKIPLRREGTPRDVAQMLRWLILEAHYVTGQVLFLDGGRSLR